jgi:hypothetical protein
MTSAICASSAPIICSSVALVNRAVNMAPADRVGLISAGADLRLTQFWLSARPVTSLTTVSEMRVTETGQSLRGHEKTHDHQLALPVLSAPWSWVRWVQLRTFRFRNCGWIIGGRKTPYQRDGWVEFWERMARGRLIRRCQRRECADAKRRAPNGRVTTIARSVSALGGMLTERQRNGAVVPSRPWSSPIAPIDGPAGGVETIAGELIKCRPRQPAPTQTQVYPDRRMRFH